MTLPSSSLSISAIQTELGLTPGTSATWTYLTSYSGINTWARLAPGALSVDSNKATVVTPPASNMKIGDFRLYNNASNTPSISGPSTLNYLGTTTITVTYGYLPEAMNIWSYAVPGDYLTTKYYKTSANRLAETSYLTPTVAGANTYTMTYSTSAPPTGHSRTSSQVVGSTQGPHQFIIKSTDVAGFTTPNQIIYADSYISDSYVSGQNRKIDLGSSISAGYTQFTCHQQQLPTLTGGAFVTPPPSGYTAIWPAINSSSSPVCTDTTLTESNGQTTYDFYLSMFGVYGAGTRVQEVTSCNVSLKVGGSSATIATGVTLGYSSKTHFTGSIPGGLSGGAFNYDEAWTVEVSSVTWGSNYTVCS